MGIAPGAGTETSDTFSLQLNSGFFSASPACSSAANPAECQAWQQFVYATTSDAAFKPRLFMQYWLLNYGSTCPTTWKAASGEQGDCYVNSPAVMPATMTASELGGTSLEGSAAVGGSDQAILITPTAAYAISNADSVLDLASSWNAAEFGIFGDSNGTQATFGAGTTLRVMTATDNGTALSPTCSREGFTSETNNLHLAKTPVKAAGSTPSIVSEQSNAFLSKASCVASSG
jgi:hypothetical protein